MFLSVKSKENGKVFKKDVILTVCDVNGHSTDNFT